MNAATRIKSNAERLFTIMYEGVYSKQSARYTRTMPDSSGSMLSYQSLLRAEMAARIARNPSYSLRAFAKSLELSPALLSLVFNNKRHLSAENSARVAARLGLNEQKRDLFCTLAQIARCKQIEEKEYLNERLVQLVGKDTPRDLELDSFRVMSDWHHVALLEMLDLDENISLQSAAKRLQLNVVQAQDALDRLVRLGLVRRRGKGFLKTNAALQCKSEARSQALRDFHRQMLEKMKTALETQSNQEKFHSTHTFAFDPKGLEKAKEILRQAMDKIENLGGKLPQRTTVYHLSISLFNLLDGDKK